MHVVTEVLHLVRHHHGIHSTGLHVGRWVRIRAAMLRRWRFRLTSPRALPMMKGGHPIRHHLGDWKNIPKHLENGIT